MRMRPDPDEVQRQVVMAFALEATVPKTGCTSRYRDVGPKQPFEHFLVSAVNSGRWFRDLAERLQHSGGQPPVFYDLALGALRESRRSRSGKYLSHGLLEAMFPVVAARLLHAGGGAAALKSVPQVLKATSEQDVRSVAAMRRLVYAESSKAFKREFPFHEEGGNLYDHYAHHRTVAHEASRLFVSELMDGMPLTALILDHLRKPLPLAERIEQGFEEARARTAMPLGALADFTAAALFLALADGPELPFVN